jgi:hypothetical protein
MEVPLSLYSKGSSYQYPMYRMLGGSQTRTSLDSGEDVNLRLPHAFTLVSFLAYFSGLKVEVKLFTLEQL